MVSEVFLHCRVERLIAAGIFFSGTVCVCVFRLCKHQKLCAEPLGLSYGPF